MMTLTNNTTKIISSFIFLMLVVLTEGRLVAKFARNGQTEGVSKVKSALEKDRISRQLNNGDSLPEETTSICGLVSEERRYGQGLDLQTVKRNINTCCITSVLTSKNPEQHGEPCKFPQMCVANGSSVEKMALLDGHREVTSALGCRCLDPLHPCRRETNIRVFHWGTTYEKAVDVGRCIGSCNKGKKMCQALNTKIVNIKGPNGGHCVKKVLKCGCARSCYRASFRQVFTTTMFGEQKNFNKTLEKVVDIGRCVGECSKTNKGRCLHWVENPLRRPGSTQPPKVCMLSLPGGEIGGNCRPSSLKARVLFVADGAPKSVNVIKRCECC